MIKHFLIKIEINVIITIINDFISISKDVLDYKNKFESL
jgi:hypothetical protein